MDVIQRTSGELLERYVFLAKYMAAPRIRLKIVWNVSIYSLRKSVIIRLKFCSKDPSYSAKKKKKVLHIFGKIAK